VTDPILICTQFVHTLDQDYQWDPEKADLNRKKHGIDFADAVGVFEDDWALTLGEQVVESEQRFATVGVDFLGRIIVVIYVYRGDDIRIISARPATKAERGMYDERRI
jgi:uncharacterized DUF497 family protein